MGGMITVDPWLLDLAEKGLSSATIARQLAYAQHNLTRDSGHMLALNDAYVRRKVQQSARAKKIARVMVRCIRCGCVASLADWIGIAAKTEQERFRFWEAIRQSQGDLAAQFVQTCPGDAKAAEYLAVLDGINDGRLA